MSKRLLQPIRPYICRDCRTRITSHLVKIPRRSIVRSSGAKDSLDNAETVERRIKDLGGRENVGKLYGYLKRKQPDETVLAASVFADDYMKSWQRDRQESEEQRSILIYGRVTARRKQGGKLAFVELAVGGKTMSVGMPAQAMFNIANLENHSDAETSTEAFREAVLRVRRGDWIAVRGVPEYSHSGQWQIRATELPTFLAPSLQSVPTLLTDPEFRMRNRHADQIVNPSARDMVFLRDRLLRSMRDFLTERNFIEVNTPLLVAGAGGAAARAFETIATEFSDITLNLRVAPEIFLKRLIIGGMQRVFELGPAFRNEGVDLTHNPEFTIAEFYGIMLTLPQLMSLTEELFKTLAATAERAAEDLHSVPNCHTKFASPFPVLPFIPTLGNTIREKLPNWKFPDLGEPTTAADTLMHVFKTLSIPMPSATTLPKLLDALAGHFIEPMCQDPTFIINQPECMAPLAKSFMQDLPSEGHGAQCRVSARAELFIGGREYVNCYEEENSPIEQRRKFEEQLSLYGSPDETGSREVDESYIHALEWGMPPTGGWGCGFDRIVMLFGGRERIADVLPFGTLRNVVGLGSRKTRPQGSAMTTKPPSSRPQTGASSQKNPSRGKKDRPHVASHVKSKTKSANNPGSVKNSQDAEDSAMVGEHRRQRATQNSAPTIATSLEWQPGQVRPRRVVLRDQSRQDQISRRSQSSLGEDTVSKEPVRQTKSGTDLKWLQNVVSRTEEIDEVTEEGRIFAQNSKRQEPDLGKTTDLRVSASSALQAPKAMAGGSGKDQ